MSRFQKSGPTPAQATHDQLLTNVAIAFIQSADKFVARNVFPTVPVRLAAGSYKVYPKGSFLRDQVAPRPRGGRVPVIGHDLDEAQYACVEEGLSTFIDDRDRANSVQPINLENSKTRLLTSQHLIHLDRLWARRYMVAGVWDTELAGVAAAPGAGEFLQFDQSASDPVGLIDELMDTFEKQSGGFRPNRMVVGKAVHRALKNHADILDRYKHVQPGIITEQMLAAVFGVEKYLVPGAVYNSAAEGLADDIQYAIGENDVLLLYAASSASIEEPSAGYTFAWDGLMPQGGLEAAVMRWRDDPAHSDWFEVRMATDVKVVATELGIFLEDAVGG